MGTIYSWCFGYVVKIINDEYWWLAPPRVELNLNVVIILLSRPIECSATEQNQMSRIWYKNYKDTLAATPNYIKAWYCVSIKSVNWWKESLQWKLSFWNSFSQWLPAKSTRGNFRYEHSMISLSIFIYLRHKTMNCRGLPNLNGLIWKLGRTLKIPSLYYPPTFADECPSTYMT